MTEIDISTDRARLDLDYIHRFLAASYWAEGIPRDVVAKSIRHSFCFGVYKGGRQIGFARVITDFTTFAYLADVFIDPAQRHRGYGGKLISAILADADLRGLRRWHLITKDAQPFYQNFGFGIVAKPEGHMEIYQKPAYGTFAAGGRWENEEGGDICGPPDGPPVDLKRNADARRKEPQ